MLFQWTGSAAEKQVVDWVAGNTGKQGYAYYMEKEINEQPEALKRILTNYLWMAVSILAMKGLWIKC